MRVTIVCDNVYKNNGVDILFFIFLNDVPFVKLSPAF